MTPGTAELAWARVDWRLPGLSMEDKQPMLVNGATGEFVRGAQYVSVSSERAEIVFEMRPAPTEPTTFFLYYLPFDDRPCQVRQRTERSRRLLLLETF